MYSLFNEFTTKPADVDHVLWNSKLVTRILIELEPSFDILPIA